MSETKAGSHDPYRRGEDLVQVAAWIARRIHDGQVRKFGADKGRPYFSTHLVRAEAVARRMEPDNYELRALMFIHDAKEDHPSRVDLAEFMELRFPPEVLNGMFAMTRRPGVGYVDYLKTVFTCPLARAGKRCDMEDNWDDGNGPVKYRIGLQLMESWESMRGMLVSAGHGAVPPPGHEFLLGEFEPVVGDYLRAKEGAP